MRGDSLHPARPHGRQLAEDALVGLMERRALVGVIALDAGLLRRVLHPRFRERKDRVQQPLGRGEYQRQTPERGEAGRSAQHIEG